MKRILFSVTVAAALALTGLVEACSGMIKLPDGTVQVGDYFYVDTSKYTVDNSDSNKVPKTSTQGTAVATTTKQQTTLGPVASKSVDTSGLTGAALSSTGSSGPSVPLGTIAVYEQIDGLFYFVEFVTEIPVLGGDEVLEDEVVEEVVEVPPPPPPPLFVQAPASEAFTVRSVSEDVSAPEEAAPLELETEVVIS
ncbi:MAG: hypothetical protein R3F62_19460 [Planctomycetota bacterium]